VKQQHIDAELARALARSGLQDHFGSLGADVQAMYSEFVALAPAEESRERRIELSIDMIRATQR